MSDEQSFGRQKRKQRSLCPALPSAIPGEEFQGKRVWKRRILPLSLKDICTIEILPEIIEAGVTSLKIEGRMKQPAYTAGVTGMYRKYLDFLFEKGPANYHVTEKDKKYLLDLFNRGGSCTGYYQMGNGPQMMAFTNEKKTGEVFLETKQLKEKITGELHLVPGSPVLLHVSCQGEEHMNVLEKYNTQRARPVTEGAGASADGQAGKHLIYMGKTGNLYGKFRFCSHEDFK